MGQAVRDSLHTALRNWDDMQTSKMDTAEEDANRFEESFYAFIDCVRRWFSALRERPRTVAETEGLPLIREISEQLPAALLLNFETELELIVAGEVRVDDEKYD